MSSDDGLEASTPEQPPIKILLETVKQRRGFFRSFVDGETGARLTLSILLGLTPNLVIGYWFYQLSQASEQQQALLLREQSRSASQAQLSAELLESASEVVANIYPLGRADKAWTLSQRNAIYRAEKRFEVLYWGKMGLVRLTDVQPCLTALHIVLGKAAAGKPSSASPEVAQRRLQTLLSVTADNLRGPENENRDMVSSGSMRDFHATESCRGPGGAT